MTFDNDVLCAENGEEENATGMRVPKLERRTAKFGIIGLDVWGLVASGPKRRFPSISYLWTRRAFTDHPLQEH